MLMKASTERRFQPVEIGQVEGTRAVVEAVPEPMSAHAGIAMLGRIEAQYGLVAELARRVNDPRLEYRVDHNKFDVILQRVVQIAGGHADGNDCDWLKKDPAVKWALNRDPAFGKDGMSQETGSRFESKAINKNNRRQVLNVFIDHYIRLQKRKLRRKKTIVIEFDGTMIKTHGCQQGAIYRGGKYKHEMYFPLLIFIGSWLVGAILRTGSKSEAKTIHSELKVIVTKLRQSFPRTKIKIRMDAAFGSPALYRYCRQERIEYEIGLRPTTALAVCARSFMQEAESQFLKQFGEPRFVGAKGKQAAQAEHDRIRNLPADRRMRAEQELRKRRTRVVGEFSYKAEKWKHWERIIARCDFTDKGLDVRYVLVSQLHGVPRAIYEDSYCQRGLSEQFIGQLKRTGQKLSAQTFRSNQFRLVLYGVAYQLLVHLRERAGLNFERSDVQTLRRAFMSIPMVVRRTATKIVFQISEHDPRCRDFLAVWRRLKAA